MWSHMLGTCLCSVNANSRDGDQGESLLAHPVEGGDVDCDVTPITLHSLSAPRSEGTQHDSTRTVTDGKTFIWFNLSS